MSNFKDNKSASDNFASSSILGEDEICASISSYLCKLFKRPILTSINTDDIEINSRNINEFKHTINKNIVDLVREIKIYSMNQIHIKKKSCIRITEISFYNKSFDEFIITKSYEELRDIFIYCLNSSAIVKNVEGQTFISKVISKLNLDTHNELSEIIKSFVPKLSSNLLICYGKILYMLWIEYISQNDEKKMQNLEEVIQKTFCMGSIKLNPVIALRMRLILHSFHTNRDDVRVNKLLLRLYDPIIWRYLSVANWKVRLNTTALLAMLFPLIDPSLSTGVYNSELDNQFSIIQNLLVDSHSEVRIAAIQSVSRILTLYWEITPIERIHEILSTLSTKSIKDKNSSSARVAVINGMNAIINNPLSQNIMKGYLPNIFAYLHDLDIEVRYSVALLILKISRIQGFDYSQIISKKQILSRISKEFIIYQVRQSTYFMKYGKLCENSNILINDIFSNDQDSVFESLKVARVLAELLNPSIFIERAKEQLKNCYFFCDLCPIGMIGYFCSLKIFVDETIGKNIQNSDLLRLAVLIITTTIENYQKNKITYNKAKILLASSKEILSIVFSNQISLVESNQEVCYISNYNDKKRRNTTQIAIKYFTNACNDDFLLKIDPNDKIWVSILQLLQHQTVLNSSFYPKFSQKLISELWNHSLAVFRNRLDEKSARTKLGTIILLSKNWKLLDNIIPILVDNACKLLSNKLITDHEIINANLEAKLIPKDIGAFSLNTLLNILIYNEIRVYFSNNSSLISCIEKLANSILNTHINETSLEIELDTKQLTKKLLIYCLAIIKNEKSFYELILIIFRKINYIANDINHSFDQFLLLFEILGTALSIPNSNLSNEKKTLEEIAKMSEDLLITMRNILEMSDRSELFEIRVRQGINTYLFALKQIIGSSNFELVSLSKEIESKLDIFPEISK
ncbi:HEAT repeat-containing protein [Cryptosporidium ubiquitum]|uniref:HEAT repeat-containing protein n=1 Tax=Cryptosporidium ubiquitum TaxID=857276 RepID=A0A1J4MLK4_9CRYT|nr:HEAT repeat-containing protein [Cryptosporidium ubiquitum]OII73749.1 HEAT repeat-containing protein [Cryptosporidium ubiquitum]